MDFEVYYIRLKIILFFGGYNGTILKEVKCVMPKWLEFNAEKLTGKINALPQRDDIDLNIREHLIIELYSK